MKLYVCNFGCFSDNTFHFPDDGSVLISAPSGSGKTTLLRAILFALFGGGGKVTQFGRRSCIVELVWQDLHIRRTKGPVRLIVNQNMEDAEGQAYIDSYIRGRTCMLDQQCKQSFLTLSQNDKLQYLERLAFGSANIMDRVAKTKSIIRELDKKQIEVETTASILHGHLDKLQPVEQVTLDEPWTDDLIDRTENMIAQKTSEYESMRSEHMELMCRRATLESKQASISREIEHAEEELSLIPDVNLMASNDHLIALRTCVEVLLAKRIWIECMHKVSNLEAMQNQYKMMSEDLTEPLDMNTLRADIQKMEQICVLWNQHNRSEMMLAELGDDENEAIQTLSLKQDEMRSECASLHLLYTQMKDTHPCPKCTAPLRWTENGPECVDSSSVDATSRSSVRTRLKEACQLLDNVTLEYEDMVARQRKRDVLYTQLVSDDDLPSISLEYAKQLRNEKETLLVKSLDSIRASSSLETKLEDVNNRLVGGRQQRDNALNLLKVAQESHMDIPGCPCNTSDNLDDVVEMLQRSQQTLHTKEQEYTRMRVYQESKENLVQKLAQLRHHLGVVLPEIEVVKERERQAQIQVDTIREQLDQLTTRLPLYRAYSRWHIYKMQRDECTLELNHYNDQAESIAQDQATYARILELISLAQSRAIEHVITRLNRTVQMYLDGFFPDDPISVILTPFKTTKTKGHHAELNITVFYKDSETSLNTLSGGERDRVVLAYALAMAEIEDAPFMLLDECVSSLDQNNAHIVFETIQERWRGRLVLFVAHQIVTGMFDHTVSLGQKIELSES